jgi:hypothetical protein
VFLYKRAQTSLTRFLSFAQTTAGKTVEDAGQSIVETASLLSAAQQMNEVRCGALIVTDAAG